MNKSGAVLALFVLSGCSSTHVNQKDHSWFPVTDAMMGQNHGKCGGFKDQWTVKNSNPCAGTPTDIESIYELEKYPFPINFLVAPKYVVKLFIVLPAKYFGGGVLDLALTPVHAVGHAISVPFSWSPADHSGEVVGMGIQTGFVAVEQSVAVATGEVGKAAAAVEGAMSAKEMLKLSEQAKERTGPHERRKNRE
jgi:hypothetical protein